MPTLLFPLLDTCIQEAQVLRNLSPRTTKWWATSYEYFCKFSGIEYLEDVTEQVLRDFLFHGRAKRNWCAATQDSYHRALTPFLKWCIKRGYLTDNPLARVERPRLPKQLPKSVTVKDARKILDTTLNLRYTYRFERYRNHAFLSLLVFTGLRLQEALSLTCTDINLEENLVRVRNGKGGKERLVPICLQLRVALLRYICERKRLKRNCPQFFTSTRGDIPLTANGVKLIFRRIRKATKVEFSAHRLRHTFATLMLQQGCDIFYVSKLLGHSDIKTTTIYLSASVSQLQTEIQKHPLNFPPPTGKRRTALPSGDGNPLRGDIAEW